MLCYNWAKLQSPLYEKKRGWGDFLHTLTMICAMNTFIEKKNYRRLTHLVLPFH